MDTRFERSGPSSKEEWLTPPEIISTLGKFDLDPCAPIDRPWPTAKNHYTIDDNGLLLPWNGRVWLNPPYGNKTEDWLRRMSAHGNGIVLIFARTETGMFFRHVWIHADAILFIRGRLKFFNIDGTMADNSAGAPSCLIAYGEQNVQALLLSNIEGKVVYL